MSENQAVEPVEIIQGQHPSQMKEEPQEIPLHDEPKDAAKEAATEETEEQKQEKHKSRNQRRVENARRAQALAEGEAKALREQLAKANKPAEPAAKATPKREDFDDYEAYLDARSEFKAEEKAAAIIKADREANKVDPQKAVAAAAHAELTKNWTEREDAYEASNADYRERVTEFVQDPDGLRKFSDAARRFIVESDVGPQVLDALASNLDEAERISALSPARQIIELGKLEDKAEPVAKKTTSKAPTPPTPAKSTKAQGKDPSKMSIAELQALAKASGSRWAN